MTVVRQWAPTHYFTLQAPNGADERDILDFYNGLSSVQYVAPNTMVEALATFDPQFPLQIQWPQVGLRELANGTPDPASGWAITAGTFRPIVAVVDIGFDLGNQGLFENYFINTDEIPHQVLTDVGDLNNNGVTDWHDLDIDRDGALTFGDLDAANLLTNGKACPAGLSPPANRCNPRDLVSGAGSQ